MHNFTHQTFTGTLEEAVQATQWAGQGTKIGYEVESGGETRTLAPRFHPTADLRFGPHIGDQVTVGGTSRQWTIRAIAQGLQSNENGTWVEIKRAEGTTVVPMSGRLAEAAR
jgi:hypothetical protein